MISSSKKTALSPDWIQQIPSSIAIIDSNFKFVSASPLWYKTFGFLPKEIEDNDILKIFPSISQELKTRLSYSLEGLKDVKIIQKLENSTSHNENYVWNLNPWKDGYGNIIGVTIKVESISKTQELEIELQKTKSLLNQKANIAKIGSWEYVIDSKKLTWSPTVNSIYGVPNDFKPNLEKAINFYKEGYSRTTLKKAIDGAISSGKPWNVNLELVKNDGTVIWVNSIGRPKYKDGACTRIIGTVQDITTTIKNNRKDNQNIDEYPLFENVPFGMIVSDYETGKIIEANKNLLDLLGCDKQTLLNKTLKEFIGKNYIKEFLLLKKQVEQNKKFENYEIQIPNKEGKNLHFNISASLVQKKCGDTILTTLTDITHRKEKDKKFKKLISSSNEKNDQLLNFAHMVSHNLKAHATNFSLLLNFLNEENGENERKKLMNMLFNASDNLADTIKGLREVVAIKTTLDEKKQLLSLNESVFTVEQNVVGLLKESNGKIINEIPDTIKVNALPAYLESILTNCITNAIKYKQDDKSPIIILSIAENDDYIILSIEDNGKGIDMKKYGSKLFGLYNTFHKNKNARGIGLFIAKNQIEAMNGKIEAESTVNQGSTFKIYFNKKY